jgi:hypothetical protein
MKKNKAWLKKSKFVSPLIAFFFFVGSIAVVADLNNDSFFVSITKPLLMPLLLIIYWISVKTKENAYLCSLLLLWIANIIFVSNLDSNLILGTIPFLLAHIALIYIVIRRLKNPGTVSMLMASLPFLLFYLIASIFSYGKTGIYLPLVIIEGIFMIFYGSLCLTNYFNKATRLSSYLLTSAVLAIFVHLLLIVNQIMLNNQILNALTSILLVFSQYLFYQFMLLEEKRRKRYKILNDSSVENLIL